MKTANRTTQTLYTLLFGGSFDPPHLGHEAVLKASLTLQDWAEIRVIPTNCSADKNPVASSKARLEMCTLAFSDLSPKVKIDDQEIKRGGITYTFDTVHNLQKSGLENLCILMGADSFSHIHRFYRATDWIDTVRFLIYPRNADTAEILTKKWSTSHAGLQFSILQAPTVEVSSSQIRAALSVNNTIKKALNYNYLNNFPKEISKFLSPKVEFYLKTHKLYGT